MIGTISSNKMDKALGVTVYTVKKHAKYKKSYKVRKSYLVACDDSSKYVINQEIEFVETRPISKRIKFKVVEK